MSNVPPRPASGVRIAGDDYQHLVTWNEVLRGLQPESYVTHITVEAPDAGNLDDIVIEHGQNTATYIQVKHTVDARTPVGSAYLLQAGSGTSKKAKRSLLARFRDTDDELRARGDVEMQLVTDREADPSDPLLSRIDRRTECLIPAILVAGLPAAVSTARAQWADHLGVDEDALIALLTDLRIRTGRPYNAEEERAATLMWGHGLRAGPRALAVGIAMVREWVQERQRRRSIDQLRDLIAARCETADEPGAVLIVEAIDDDPHPEDATEHLRFVERYAGDDANSRRELLDASDWQHVIAPGIEQAANRLRTSGHRRVVVRGALRLPMWFAVGAALRHVHGFDVAALQHGTLWSSQDATGPFPTLNHNVTDIGAGTDLAVAAGVAVDPTSAAARYINEANLSVRRLVTLTPPTGPGPQAVQDSPEAARLAVSIRHAVLQELDEHPAERIHLFLATPGGLALLLGHRWNALRPTVVYEHLGAGRGYVPTVTVSS